MTMDVASYEFIKRRAAYPIWLKFRVNRYELGFMIQLESFLRYYDRQIVGRFDMINNVTNSVKEKTKMNGYMHGCIDKGCIGCYEYISRPGSMCIGFSDLGLKVLESYYVELDKLGQRYAHKRSTMPEPIRELKKYTKLAA